MMKTENLRDGGEVSVERDERKESSEEASFRRVRRHEAVMTVDKGSFSIDLITDLHLFFAVSISPISMATTVVFFGDFWLLLLPGMRH